MTFKKSYISLGLLRKSIVKTLYVEIESLQIVEIEWLQIVESLFSLGVQLPVTIFKFSSKSS